MAEPKNQPPNTRAPWTVIDLFHKERGGKGVWKGIAQGTPVRVTKNIGKRIKVVVKSSVKFTRSDLTLRLIDLASGLEKDGQFSFESSSLKDNEWGGETADMELKVYSLAKKLIFHSNIRTDNGTLVSRSVWFGTHNSGKQRKKRKGSDEDSPVKRQKLNEDEYSVDYSDEGTGTSQDFLPHNSHSAIVLPSFQQQQTPKRGSIPRPISHLAADPFPQSNRTAITPYQSQTPSHSNSSHLANQSTESSPFRNNRAGGSSSYPGMLFFGKYPDYRNHFTPSGLAELLDVVTQSPNNQIEWYQGTPPSQNKTTSIVVEETMQLFGCVNASMAPSGVILSIRNNALIPVILAGILQFSSTVSNPHILSSIVTTPWTFTSPTTQKEVEILKEEAQRYLDAFPSTAPISNEGHQISETKTQTLSFGNQYVNLELQLKWSPSSGMSLSELHRLNSWTNESLIPLGLNHVSQRSGRPLKFIFSLLSSSHQNENLTLAIYRFDKLLHCDNHHINPRCSALCVEESELKGVYTFVAFFNRPIREFPFSGFISLHDFRTPTIRQVLLPCTPSEINFPHIWIVGYLTVEGNYFGFGCKMNDQNEIGIRNPELSNDTHSDGLTPPPMKSPFMDELSINGLGSSELMRSHSEPIQTLVQPEESLKMERNYS